MAGTHGRIFLNGMLTDLIILKNKCLRTLRKHFFTIDVVANNLNKKKHFVTMC